MARKGWDSLRPDYRERLERNGVSRQDYEQGASLKKGRGHEKTPERPRYYDAAKYKEYHQRRSSLEKQLADKKKDLFGNRAPDAKGRPRWNAERSEQNIRENPPSLKMLQWALEASEDELIDAIREDDETFSFLGYH